MIIENKPKISVVIPVYNVESFLSRCIESAINQTLNEIEIICIDDGSTDNSGALLDSYAESDKRIKVVHKTNEGYGIAMNKGLDLANGEFFSILESDDFCMPDTCEILYKTAKKFDADVVRADYFDFTTRNGVVNLKAKQMSENFTYYYRLICPNEEKEVYTFVMHNWTGIYKMAFLREKSIRYNETPGASYQDNGFFFQVFSQTRRLVYVPKPFYCYRIDNPQSSIYDSQKVYTMAEEYAFIRKYLSKHPEFENEVLPVFYARMFRSYHQTFLRIAPEYRDDFSEFFRTQFIEAKDLHLLDTKYYSKSERILLQALLNSAKAYKNLVFIERQRNLVKKSISVLQKEGLGAFCSKSKKYLVKKWKS